MFKYYCFLIVKHDLNHLKISENSRFVGSELVVGSSEQDSLVEKGCTEMVPNLIWAPDFFGPQEIWSPRNLDPKKFGL